MVQHAQPPCPMPCTLPARTSSFQPLSYLLSLSGWRRLPPQLAKSLGTYTEQGKGDGEVSGRKEPAATEGGSGDRAMPALPALAATAPGAGICREHRARGGGSPFAQYCIWFWTLNKQHPKAFAKPAGGTPVLFGSHTTATLLNLPLFRSVS